MSRSDAWMPFYVADYLGDTGHLRMAAHGAYVLLIFHYWRKGPLADDDASLAAIARASDKEWKAVAPQVREFFTVSDGKLHHKRIEAERQKTAAISAKRAAAGLAGAQQKHGKRDGKPMAIATPLPAERQTQSQLQEQKKEGSELRSGAGGAVGLPMDLPPDRPQSPRALVFGDGIPIIRGLTGQSEQQARQLLGRLLASTSDDCRKVHAALCEAHDLKPADPVAWLMAACGARRDGRKVAKTAYLIEEFGGRQ